MVKHGVGNCFIQRIKHIKQKKRNRIKMPTPVRLARYDTKV